MIVKVQFGDSRVHIRVIECSDIHLEQQDGYVELICHTQREEPSIIRLGGDSTDHLYLMDKGQTVDHMVFN